MTIGPQMTFQDQHGIPIRPGLAQAIERAWARLAEPGTWWTGDQRIAIARETRQAMTCALCAARKDALSPMHVEGHHDSLGVLSTAAIDAIHDDSWAPVNYPGAVRDPDTGAWISDAEVAETTYTAFGSPTTR